MAGRKRRNQKRQDVPEAASGPEESAPKPWRVRYAEEVLTGDARKVGRAALVAARQVIDKKLKADPEQYGQRLHSPLHGLFKLKSSHVRIAYHVEKARREVWVLMIGDRREMWDEDPGRILVRLGIVRTRVEEEEQSGSEEPPPNARGR